MEKHTDKINWEELSKNPNAISLLEKHTDKIDWKELSKNPNAISLLEKHTDKIDWKEFLRNPNIWKSFLFDIEELIINKLIEEEQTEQKEQKEQEEQTEQKECPICYENLNLYPVITLECFPTHIFHKICLFNVCESSTPICPMCRSVISSQTCINILNDNKNKFSKYIYLKQLLQLLPSIDLDLDLKQLFLQILRLVTVKKTTTETERNGVTKSEPNDVNSEYEPERPTTPPQSRQSLQQQSLQQQSLQQQSLQQSRRKLKSTRRKLKSTRPSWNYGKTDKNTIRI